MTKIFAILVCLSISTPAVLSVLISSAQACDENGKECPHKGKHAKNEKKGKPGCNCAKKSAEKAVSEEKADSKPSAETAPQS